MVPTPGENALRLRDAIAELKLATHQRRLLVRGSGEYLSALQAESRLARAIYDLANAVRTEQGQD